MKLYLASMDIPTPGDLATLLGKALGETSVALIPNAKDYYSERARSYKIDERLAKMKSLGLTVKVVDLRDYTQPAELKAALSHVNLIWVMGGNTFCLREEMKNSGFDQIIVELLEGGIVYGGDSAGAIIAGTSIRGIESADIPQFAETVIDSGLGLVPYVVLPHADNTEFTEAVRLVRAINQGKAKIIELKDAQAVIFDNSGYRVVEAGSQQVS